MSLGQLSKAATIGVLLSSAPVTARKPAILVRKTPELQNSDIALPFSIPFSEITDVQNTDKIIGRNLTHIPEELAPSVAIAEPPENIQEESGTPIRDLTQFLIIASSIIVGGCCLRLLVCNDETLQSLQNTAGDCFRRVGDTGEYAAAAVREGVSYVSNVPKKLMERFNDWRNDPMRSSEPRTGVNRDIQLTPVRPQV